MSEHIFSKADVIHRLELCLKKTLGEIDNKGIFNNFQNVKYQKGIAGTIIEQCVFGYEPDCEQRPDLSIIDAGERVKTELKVTGVVLKVKPREQYVAKEPMSITAVGIYDISNQTFATSHFFAKLENLLIVYYHYLFGSSKSVSEYRKFPVVGFEFHKFTDEDIAVFKKDWESVYALCLEVLARHPGTKNKRWEDAVKEDYISVHGRLRNSLSFIDLAPKFPPRFRLKKPVVSAIVANHFGYDLEQLPGRYTSILDIDIKCDDITRKFKGYKISELADILGVTYDPDNVNKAIAEQIVVAMFGGNSHKLNQVELFVKFGLVGKTVTLSDKGGKTEDTKLYHIDFDEMVQTFIEDDELGRREFVFEDSEMYSYFADHEFLCILFREPTQTNKSKTEGNTKKSNILTDNVFVGFKRLVFNDDFIDSYVRPVWLDTRDKIMNDKLKDVVSRKKTGEIKYTKKSHEISTAPNFLKSSENTIFFRGSGTDSSTRHKTECVNGIKMLPQYLWIKGTVIVDMLGYGLKKKPKNIGKGYHSVYAEGEDLSSLKFVAETDVNED